LKGKAVEEDRSRFRAQAKKKLANLYDYLTEHRQSFGR
jgi:hypothetical protein